MLKHLHISNYALIERLEIDFHPGMSTLTGETGAGKSIILGALGLLRGARADSGKLAGGAKAVVEASFSYDGLSRIEQILGSLDIDLHQDKELLLRREITTAGRSRAFINDTPVSLATLSAVGDQLIDIHSQHANSLLTNPGFLLELIDTHAAHTTLLEAYREAYGAYRDLHGRLSALKSEKARAKENEEFIAFRLEHLNRLKPKAGELAELEQRQQLLSDSSLISDSLSEALELLNASDSGVIDSLAGVGALLRRVNLQLLGQDSDLASRIESARIDLADVAATLQECLENVEADPAELERTEARLDELYEAQRRFGVDSEQALLQMQQELLEQYAALDPDDSMIRTLEEKLHEQAQALKKLAHELSDSRRRSASEIAGILTDSARSLAMPNLRLSLTLTAGKLTSTGADTPQLLVAFNKNQELREVSKVASGGEISRLMLCLKLLMAGKMQLPTIIFDEVDTGVSGQVADAMGALMHRISENIQVLTITHLPQVAAKGDMQYKVYKEDTESATHTHIRLLSGQERIREIAGMLSGGTITEAALGNAAHLLSENQ